MSYGNILLGCYPMKLFHSCLKWKILLIIQKEWKCCLLYFILIKFEYPRWICTYTTDILQRSQNLHHLDPGMGLKLGVFGFSRNQNNGGSSDAYVTCLYCGLSVRTNMHKTWRGTCKSWTHFHGFFLVYSCMCSVQNKIEPYGRRGHFTGRYRRSGISRIYLWHTQKDSHVVTVLWQDWWCSDYPITYATLIPTQWLCLAGT